MKSYLLASVWEIVWAFKATDVDVILADIYLRITLWFGLGLKMYLMYIDIFGYDKKLLILTIKCGIMFLTVRRKSCELN